MKLVYRYVISEDLETHIRVQCRPIATLRRCPGRSAAKRTFLVVVVSCHVDHLAYANNAEY